MYPNRYYKWGAHAGEGGSTRPSGPSYRIAPVEVGQASPLMSFMVTLLQMQLARNLESPTFDEKGQMWSDFTWEWEQY